MAGKRTVKRAPLDRERILRAAIALADADGLAALSMRKLGQRLGVEAMSLYKHVANKEEVLEGIVDLVLGDVDVAESARSWKGSMRTRALSLREVFLRHPWAVGLLEARRNLGPIALRYCDAVLGVLRRAGFSTAAAVRAFSLIDSYVYGFSIQEKSLPSGPKESAEITERFLRQLPASEYPRLAETAAHVMRSGFDTAREFEVGLDLLLDALEDWRGG
jgi:AcrR family transcriptional regulator